MMSDAEDEPIGLAELRDTVDEVRSLMNNTTFSDLALRAEQVEEDAKDDNDSGIGKENGEDGDEHSGAGSPKQTAVEGPRIVEIEDDEPQTEKGDKSKLPSEDDKSKDNPEDKSDNKSDDKSEDQDAELTPSDDSEADSQVPEPTPKPRRKKKAKRAIPPEHGDDIDKPILTKEEAIGHRLEIRKLYATNSTCSCCTTWTDKLPAKVILSQGFEVGIEKTLDYNKTFALVQRHSVHGHNLRTTSIDVKNPKLRAHMESIFDGYPGIDLSNPWFTFEAPFYQFAHRWQKFLDIQREESDTDVMKMLNLLRDIVLEALQLSFLSLKECEETGYIDFSTLGMVFVPGEHVVNNEDGVLSAGILREAKRVTVRDNNSKNKTEYWKLEVDVVDWNGTISGFRQVHWSIKEYEGRKRLTKLDAFPLKSHAEHERIKERLIDRGKRFESLRGQHVKHYSGRVSSTLGWFFVVTSYKQLSERIVVDAAAYYNFQEQVVPDLKSFDGLKEDSNDIKWAAPEDYSLTTPAEAKKREEDLEPLTDEQRMLAVPYVKGFALSSKSWYHFDVDSVKEVAWSESVFENLVLNEEEKELLLALISRDDPLDGEFDDFVEGKGKAMIMLLCGPPGVGKTLTAESVAEQLKRPLYRVGAGEVGSSVSDVQSSLKKALDLCAHWNAVLLIDEADVFLERRSSDNLDRNKLVSIFLVLLEYYEGVLILTTNRTDSLDSAFESRIDITLTYSELDVSARTQIWNNFLRRFPADSHAISDDDVKVLAERRLNGRQIKSAIKSARILAAKGGRKLGRRELEIVLRIREKASKLLTDK